MTVNEAYSIIRALPQNDRHALLTRVIADVELEHFVPHADADEARAHEIQERIAAYERGELKAYPAEVVIQELRDSLKRRTEQ